MKAGLPMEIIQEFDTWRRVRDADGSEGWINQSLLSGRRTAIIAPWQRGKGAQINLLRSPDKDASVVAIVEPGVMGTIKTCDGQWCEMTFDGHTGWLAQSAVWGAYPGERVEGLRPVPACGADTAEMGVLKTGRQLQAVAQRAIDGDVGDPDQRDRDCRRMPGQVPGEQQQHGTIRMCKAL